MGVFRNILSDLSEIGSNRNKFKKKFTELSKLLSDYSYDELKTTRDESYRQIVKIYNELVDISVTVNKDDIFKIYFSDRDVDLSISTGLKVADAWVNDVINNHEKFTNSYMIRIIERFKNSQKANLADSLELNKLRKNFPMLENYFIEVSKTVKEMYVVVDSSIQYEYRFPILTFGRTMGYNHYGIRKAEDSFELYFYAISENGGDRFDATSKFVVEDQSNETYEEAFSKMMGEIFSNPRYLEICTGISYE